MNRHKSRRSQNMTRVASALLTSLALTAAAEVELSPYNPYVKPGNGSQGKPVVLTANAAGRVAPAFSCATGATPVMIQRAAANRALNFLGPRIQKSCW